MRPYRMPSDALTKEVSKMLTTPTAVHEMFSENVFVNADTRVAALLKAMPVAVEADAIQVCS